MSLALDQFISALPNGGARPNLFEVEITPPTGSSEPLNFKVKAASLPPVTIGVIEIPYQGRILKTHGDQSFEPWNVTVIADEGLQTRKAFEDWANSISEKQQNISTSSAIAPHMVTMTVKTYKKDGSIDTTHEFYHSWVSNIGEIALSWDQGNSIMEFPVTLQYSSFRRVS